MTAPSAPFGITVAYAERTLSATLHRLLAERDVSPGTWYALNLIAVRGPRMDRVTLTVELEGARTLTPDSVRELLARLEADGLIQGDDEVELSAEGEALHRSLRGDIAARSARLLGQFPAEDVETTVRTLQAITERAAEEYRVDAD
jgi:DNA-binding MarR family transcriptional regulator